MIDLRTWVLLKVATQIATAYRREQEKLWRDTSETDERVCGGCCDCHAYALAELFLNNGIDKADISVVHGTFNGKDHWWTELKDVIFDITVDQFGSQYPPVFVGKKSNNPEYRGVQRHDNF